MTLRQKILSLGLLVAGAIFAVLWLQYSNFQAQFRAYQGVEQGVRIVDLTSQVVHSLQKERGMRLIAGVNSSRAEMADPVRDADAFVAALAGVHGVAGSLAESVAQLRQQAVHGEPVSTFQSYSKLIRDVIETLGRLPRQSKASGAPADVYAHAQLMEAKEYLGQIRASLGYRIAHPHDDQITVQDLNRLKFLYDEKIRQFKLEASPELLEFFVLNFSGAEVAQVRQTMAMMVTTPRLPLSLDVKAWWSVATSAVDRLKIVEDHSRVLIRNKLEAERSRHERILLIQVAVTLLFSAVILMLTLSVIVNFLRVLDEALISIELIAEGKSLSGRVAVKDAGELGRISRSFNQLLDFAENQLQEKDRLAARDPLTGINNRLLFSGILRSEAERKARNKTPMSLVMFDVDHFKRINDTLGHNAGDEVLKALAHLVKDEIRATDFFCRWGGEEFVLLLRDDDQDAAFAMADKLRARIEREHFPLVGQVTCSFGLTAWTAHDTEEDFVARADRALYEAKKLGRNRVHALT